jgi:hypothetical protein
MFDYSGTFAGKDKLTRHMEFFTIEEQILYGFSWNTELSEIYLIRYDFSTKQYLRDILLPNLGWQGIRIHEGNFYFVNSKDKNISYVSLNDITGLE